MPRKRIKGDCVEVRVCMSDELNEEVERFKAKLRSNGDNIKKMDAAIELIKRELKQ